MSISIFLVEDEAWIRKGLKKMIQWEKLDAVLAGEAEDGIEACQQILEKKPQIIISDIRIPHMDGLEMVRSVMKKLGNVKVIFISGYREFEYARQAVELEAVSYILKPIDADELNRILEQTIEKIKSEQRRFREVNMGKRTFFMNVLEECVDEKLCEEIHSQSVAGYYRVLLIPALSTLATSKDFEQFVHEILRPYLNAQFFVKNKDEYIVIFFSDRKRNFEEHTFKVSHLLWENSKSWGMWALGDFVEKLSDIPVSYNHAWMAYARRDSQSNRQIVEYNPDIYSEFIVPEAPVVEKLCFMIESGRMENLDVQLNQLKEGLSNAKYSGMQSITDCIFYLCMDFIRHLQGAGISTGKYYEKCQQFLEKRFLYKDLDEIFLWFGNLLREIGDDVNVFQGKNIQRAVLAVKEYIDAHYMENITLGDMADMVYINPNYLSTVFKKVTGKNFMDYIIQKRMNKAADILAETSLGVGEIARMVGYENVRHFSRLFKKYKSVLPSEYRGRYVHEEGE